MFTSKSLNALRKRSTKPDYPYNPSQVLTVKSLEPISKISFKSQPIAQTNIPSVSKKLPTIPGSSGSRVAIEPFVPSVSLQIVAHENNNNNIEEFKLPNTNQHNSFKVTTGVQDLIPENHNSFNQIQNIQTNPINPLNPINSNFHSEQSTFTQPSQIASSFISSNQFEQPSIQTIKYNQINPGQHLTQNLVTQTQFVPVFAQNQMGMMPQTTITNQFSKIQNAMFVPNNNIGTGQSVISNQFGVSNNIGTNQIGMGQMNQMGMGGHMNQMGINQLNQMGMGGQMNQMGMGGQMNQMDMGQMNPISMGNFGMNQFNMGNMGSFGQQNQMNFGIRSPMPPVFSNQFSPNPQMSMGLQKLLVSL